MSVKQIKVGDSTEDIELTESAKEKVFPSGGTEGQVLKKTASGMEWANEAPDGKDIISPGVAIGKVLTAGGDGTCSWEDAGGGTTLYLHNIIITGTRQRTTFSITSTKSDAYTRNDIYNLMLESPISCTGYSYQDNGKVGYIILDIYGNEYGEWKADVLSINMDSSYITSTTLNISSSPTVTDNIITLS